MYILLQNIVRREKPQKIIKNVSPEGRKRHPRDSAYSRKQNAFWSDPPKRSVYIYSIRVRVFLRPFRKKTLENVSHRYADTCPVLHADRFPQDFGWVRQSCNEA